MISILPYRFLHQTDHTVLNAASRAQLVTSVAC